MVSVVVIGKDEGAGITRCLKSVRAALEGALPYELIYVDSHSADDSLARARALGARCFLPQEIRTTPALGRCIGALEAVGEQILFLDGDMTLEPGFVEAGLRAMAEGYAGACGIRRDVYLRGGAVVGTCENYFGCTERRAAPEFGGAVMLARGALLEAGNWNPDVETCEEAELHARLRARGMAVAELPVPMITHEDRVRDARGLWQTLFTRRRLGQGQALRCALAAGSARCLVLGDLPTRTWLLESLLMICAICAGLLIGGAAGFWGFLLLSLLFQAAMLVFLCRQGRARTLISALLLLLYMPAGMLSLRRRDKSYAEWEETA